MDKITQIIAEVKSKVSELDQAIAEELQSRPAKVEVQKTKAVEDAPQDTQVSAPTEPTGNPVDVKSQETTE